MLVCMCGCVATGIQRFSVFILPPAAPATPPDPQVGAAVRGRLPGLLLYPKLYLFQQQQSFSLNHTAGVHHKHSHLSPFLLYNDFFLPFTCYHIFVQISHRSDNLTCNDGHVKIIINMNVKKKEI